MTKKDLIEHLKDVPDNTVITLWQWDESRPNPNKITLLQPTLKPLAFKGLYTLSLLPRPFSKKELDKMEEERKCRVCGCTDDDCSQCIEKTGEPCSWVEEDLCSACQEE